MIRARTAAGSRAPFRLLYSVRSPEEVYYADELRRLPGADRGVEVAFVYTRATPAQWSQPPRRIAVSYLRVHGWPPDLAPTCFVCGPTGFVEAVADMLVGLGHDPGRVKTERFGPSGG